jgi:hypothetical protein
VRCSRQAEWVIKSVMHRHSIWEVWHSRPSGALRQINILFS